MSTSGDKGKGKGDKHSSNGAAAAAKPARPVPRKPPPPEPKGNPDDYLAGLDLPSSESESDEEGVGRRRGMLEEDQAVQIKQAVRM